MAISNVLQNKLLLQYLSAAGQDISSGNPIGTNVNQVTQQNIASQNFAKMQSRYAEMFKKMLNGDFTDGGKMTMGADGATVKLPNSAEGGASAVGSTGVSGVADTSMSPQPVKVDTNFKNFLNPSPSPDFNSADLAGLTPEMMTQALKNAEGISSVGYMSPSDLVDIAYKNQLIEQSKENILSSQVGRTTKERTYKLPTGEEVGETAYISYLNSHDKDNKPTSVQEYEYAKAQGYKGTLEDWQKSGTSDSTSIKEYEKAVNQGYTGKFYDWKKEMTALSGGLDLSERKAIKEMEDTVEDKNYFSKPKGGLVDDVDEYINSKEVKRQLRQYEDEKTKSKETIRAKEKFITTKITSSGGQIVGSRLDGRTFVWTVKWPDGTTSEVKYAN